MKININKFENKQGGLLEIIIFIIIAILILSFFHYKIGDVFNYIVAAFHNVFG